VRVECAWCHRHLRDICDLCGSEHVEMPWVATFGFCTNRLRCLDCGHRFDRFNSDATDGICGPCRREHFPQIRRTP
jgi:rubredoxin